MPNAVTRTNRDEYPSCQCVLIPPVPGGWMYTYEMCVKWGQGGSGSGHSGVLKEGRFLCSCTAAQMNTYGEGEP